MNYSLKRNKIKDVLNLLGENKTWSILYQIDRRCLELTDSLMTGINYYWTGDCILGSQVSLDELNYKSFDSLSDMEIEIINEVLNAPKDIKSFPEFIDNKISGRIDFFKILEILGRTTSEINKVKDDWTRETYLDTVLYSS